MHLSADEILAAVQHEDSFAREAAVEYFTSSFSTDPRVMPAVIQAIETFGQDNCQFRDIDRLIQSEETVRWLLAQIATHKRKSGYDVWYSDLTKSLLAADVRILRSLDADIQSCPGLDAKEKEAVSDRLALAELPADELWRRLEDQCRTQLDRAKEYPAEKKIAIADRLARAVAVHPEFVGERLMEILRGETGDRNKWLELYAIRLAGMMRFTPAIPTLVGWLVADPNDGLFEELNPALSAIGSDEIVERIRAKWPRLDTHSRFTAIFVLESIHTDKCLATAISLAESEPDVGNRLRLHEVALRHFSPGLVDRARQLVLEYEGIEPNELRHTLVCTCAVMGVRFPEYDKWRQDEIDSAKRAAAFMSDDVSKRTETPRVDFTPMTPIKKDESVVGRNDPCPCGSGKKYKKCCGAKK